MSESQLRALPLHGKRVLVTRTRDQAGVLSDNLSAVGAQPVELPVIRIVPPDDWSPLDRMLHALVEHSVYDWLIFTSANGVKMVMERMRALGLEPGALAGVRIATIGPATAAALAQQGLFATLIPDEYIAESVAEALRRETERREESLVGKRIVLARAAEAREVLITELERAGAQVEVIVAYRTLPVEQSDERGHEVIALFRQRRLDILTFTSSSTVRYFMQWLSQAAPDIVTELTSSSRQPDYPLIACIGPVTARTARNYGLYVGIEAREFTIAGLVEALINYEENRK